MKRFLKIVLGIILTLIVLIIGARFYIKYVYLVPNPSELMFSKNDATINFIWETQINSVNQLEKSAMFLPIKLAGCPKTFYMQFDLGAPTTRFYENKLDAINLKYKVCTIDSTESQKTLKNFAFSLNNLKIKVKTVNVNRYSDDAIDWKNETEPVIIGTIGSDLIENKILMIDYPNTKILLSEKLPDSISKKAKLTKFIFPNRKIFIPTTIGGLQSDVLFDTGSSVCDLMTSKENYDILADKNAKPHRNDGYTWGEKTYSFTTTSSAIYKFDAFSIPCKTVSYPGIDENWKRIGLKFGMYRLKILGITGNKMFLDKKVIIDTKNLKFGIIEKN